MLERFGIGSRGVVARLVRRVFFYVLPFVGRSCSQRRSMRSAVTVQWHKINNARGRSAAGFCDFSRVEHVERVEGWETVFALGARPRNAAGLSCGVPPPERARQRVGQKVVWRLHPVTSVTTRERPSPRAAAPFRPSAHDKPQRHENHLRGARKRPLRGRHEKHTKSARGGYTGGDNRAWATRKTHGLFATCIFCGCKFLL